MQRFLKFVGRFQSFIVRSKLSNALEQPPLIVAAPNLRFPLDSAKQPKDPYDRPLDFQ